MDIIHAIATELQKAVPNAVFYREQTEQRFVSPSFYLYEIEGKGTPEIGPYELRKHQFCLVYFPDENVDDPGPREQCGQMEELLLNQFNRISELSLAVLDKETRIEEGALQFTFRTRYRGVNTKPEIKMETVDAKGGLKNA